LNEINRTVQDMKEESDKDTEILLKNQIEILETNSSINPIKNSV
jgi:hypothetical protein